MLKAEAPDRFRIDFAQVKRKGAWWKVFEPKGASVVDAWAIGQAVIAALASCPFKSATGQPQVWNEYRVFLSRVDHDRLRPVETSLQKDLGPLLYEELVRINAVTVGALTVRLLVDDADELEAGAGILHARHVPDAEAPVPGAGEITVRLDKLRPQPLPASKTMPVGAVVVRGPAGEVVLRGGARHVLGRAHPDAGADHVALPGATGKISRRQVALRVDGEQLEIAREPDSNPVSAGGTPLAPGQSAVVPLPVDIVLSGGEMKLSVARA